VRNAAKSLLEKSGSRKFNARSSQITTIDDFTTHIERRSAVSADLMIESISRKRCLIYIFA